MEYLNEKDYNKIKSLIIDFVGDTLLGNNIYKAIKGYLEEKNVTIDETLIKGKSAENDYKFTFKAGFDKKLGEEANQALLNYNKKLREQLDEFAKSKKKAN